MKLIWTICVGRFTSKSKVFHSHPVTSGASLGGIMIGRFQKITEYQVGNLLFGFPLPLHTAPGSSPVEQL